MSEFIFGFAVATLLFFGIAVIASIAKGQELHHPPEHLQLHEQFYKTWMRPDARELSCCGLGDCYPVEAKVIGGKWWFANRDTKEWQMVPPEKIEYDRDNPDGQNHVCAIGGLVFCFIVGSGS